MILVAGLSPAWQQVVLLDELHVGEVNRAREVHWCASGKVLNVGIALAHLQRTPTLEWNARNPAPRTPNASPASKQVSGVPGEVASASPESSSPQCRVLAVVGGTGGDAIRQEFDGLGIASQWIISRSPTRVCTTILDRKGRTTTELVENAGSMTPDELQAFQTAFVRDASQADVVVLTGSLPAGVPSSLYRDLTRQSRGRVIVDVQGPPLLEAIAARPFLIKPNREELGCTVGRELSSDADLHAAMLELNQRGAEWVVVTQGKHAVWASHDSTVWCIEPPFVDVVNPIGCGDCLAAGLAWGLSNGLDPPAALLRGVAAASENARQLLPGRLDGARVDDVSRRLQCQRV